MFVAALLVMLILWPLVACAGQESAVGASDTEICTGNIMPYSGPLAAFATIGKADAAYFDMINDNGGINGRKFKFISYDDSSKPETAVELTRELETSIGAGRSEAGTGHAQRKRTRQVKLGSEECWRYRHH
jgi:branched-chain amino acid transport system substrate-binding protein